MTPPPRPKARGALIEIIETLPDAASVERAEELGIIVPREIRINGIPLLCPRDSPVEIDQITVNADEPVRATLTVWARRIIMGAHDTSTETDVDTLRERLNGPVSQRPGHPAVWNALRAALDHLGQPGLTAVARQIAAADDPVQPDYHVVECITPDHGTRILDLNGTAPMCDACRVIPNPHQKGI